MSETKPPPEVHDPIDWGFIVPIGALVVFGVLGLIFGTIRDARVAKEAAKKQEALRAEMAAR
ncbi:MAG: hypothetical protein AAFQ82_04810, partial [Myxococcota bacterium]